MSIAVALFLTFIYLINRELFILQAIPNAHHEEMVFSNPPHLPRSEERRVGKEC